MPSISPFLWFDTQAHEAAKFYVSLFKKGSKIHSVQRYGKGSPGKPGSVMTVDFTIQGQRVTALNSGPHYKLSPAFSFVVECANQKEIDGYWNKLVKGGEESRCGWLVDRFGVSWQIVPKNMSKLIATPEQMQAMMGMVKLDIQALKDAGKAAKKASRVK